MKQGEPRDAVFVVRMWRDPAAGPQGKWRGYVDRVGTKARVYFSNVGTMCEFMLAERERERPVPEPCE